MSILNKRAPTITEAVLRPGSLQPIGTIGTGDLAPTEVWQVRRLLLSRPKMSASKELAIRKAGQLLWGAADPEKEWYVQVAVYSGHVVTWVGEVAMPDDAGEPPQEELTKLVEAAHKVASFLNTNMVEVPGPPVIEQPSKGDAERTIARHFHIPNIDNY